MMGVLLKDRSTRAAEPVEVPLSKVAGRVPRSFHCLAKRLLLNSKRIAVIKNPGAIMRASCQNRCASRRTNGPTGIKPIQTQPVLRHRIQVRCLQRRMIHVPHLPPTLIIRHHQNHIRLGCG